MNKLTATVLGTSLLLGAATTVSAQETKPVGLSLRGGFYFGNGDNTLAAGAEFKLKDVNWEGIGQGYLGSITLSLDRIGDDRIPLMLNFVARNNEWYWTGGAGVFFGDGDTNLGFQFGLGYDFVRGSLPLFVEGKFWAGGGTSGIGLYLGVRL